MHFSRSYELEKIRLDRQAWLCYAALALKQSNYTW